MTKIEGTYDVTVIGAGIAGAAAARELSKYDLRLALLEQEADVCFGATKATHAIVHCGLPCRDRPLRDRGEREGNRLMEEVCRELDVPFQRIGKLVVAFSREEIRILKEMEDRLRENGIPGVELITEPGRLKSMEPHLSDHILGALYTPTTGITSPWALVIGLVENAVQNGCGLHLNTRVTAITRTPEGPLLLSTDAGPLLTDYVVNAAGGQAQRVAELIGDRSLRLTFLKQQRIIMDKGCRAMVRHLVRGLEGSEPVGNFVTPTIDGNIMVGSTAEDTLDSRDTATTEEGLREWVLPEYQKLIPALPSSQSIRPFAGAMPSAGPDYHIQPAPDLHRVVHFVLGASGFTASLAMAKYLVEEIMPCVGLTLREKSDFHGTRRDMPHFAVSDPAARAALIQQNPLYGRIICRCETVSEAEILEAIKRGAETRDGIKFRTRAGMGRCQSNYCGHKLLEILGRELCRPLGEITRKGRGSHEIL